MCGINEYSISQSKRLCYAADLQLQTVYALLDQAYHGRNPPQNSSDSYQSIVENNYGLAHVPKTAWQLRFGHLFGYGGRYYSYLLSKSVASLLWKQLFSADPFSRESGTILHRKLLAHGGERDPMKLLASVLGFTPSMNQLVDSVLDLTSNEKLGGTG